MPDRGPGKEVIGRRASPDVSRQYWGFLGPVNERRIKLAIVIVI